MTTQEFLSKFEQGAFNEATRQEVQGIIGSATEITPELAARLANCVERELAADLEDIDVDPQVAAALEQEVTDELAAIEASAEQTTAAVEKNLQELADASQKVDVLERLHAGA